MTMMTKTVITSIAVAGTVLAAAQACSSDAVAPEGRPDTQQGVRADGLLHVTVVGADGAPINGALVEAHYAGTVSIHRESSGWHADSTRASGDSTAHADSAGSGTPQYHALGAGTTNEGGQLTIGNLPQVRYDLIIRPASGSAYREAVWRGVQVPGNAPGSVRVVVERR